MSIEEIHNKLEQIAALESQAADLAYKEVERMARKIMGKHPRCKEFVMAMGGALFKDGDGEPIVDGYGPPFPAYLQSITAFIDDMSVRLKVSGMPMRIKGAEGELITDW